MDLAYGPRTRKQLIPGRVTPSPTSLCIKLETTLPFVSWRVLLYKQTHDAQVQLLLLLEVLGPFFQTLPLCLITAYLSMLHPESSQSSGSSTPELLLEDPELVRITFDHRNDYTA